MALINKYRIYCTTDSSYEYVLATSEPSACPTNGAHTVDASSVSLLEADVKVNDGSLKDLPLSEHKSLRINEIDARTNELIAAGFTYASKQFSLSLGAQLKMTGTHQIKDDPALVYPLNWNTIDDLDVYAIANAADLDGFFLTGVGTLRAQLDSGTALKDSVRAATDVAGVDAVIDNR